VASVMRRPREMQPQVAKVRMIPHEWGTCSRVFKMCASNLRRHNCGSIEDPSTSLKTTQKGS
jgi:hypothetical protein